MVRWKTSRTDGALSQFGLGAVALQRFSALPQRSGRWRFLSDIAANDFPHRHANHAAVGPEIRAGDAVPSLMLPIMGEIHGSSFFKLIRNATRYI